MNGGYSELAAYYQDFRSGYWAHPNASECRCKGSGWALSEVDTWHPCPIHHIRGQCHPEDAIEEEACNFDCRGCLAARGVDEFFNLVRPRPEPAVVEYAEDDIPF